MKQLLTAALLLAGIMAAATAQAMTVLITGSNRGIGLEFVRQFAADGWTVIATARKLDEAIELKALAVTHRNITLYALDVMDGNSVKALAQELGGKPIDILINNAGVLGDEAGQILGSYNYSVFQQVMGVNTFGAMAVSEALRENVIASQQKKMISITSGPGLLLNSRSSRTFYRQSKISLNMGMRAIADDIKDRGIIVGIISPGAVDTDMLRQLRGDKASSGQPPAASVASMRKVIDGLTIGSSGQVLNYDGKEITAW